MGNVVRMGEGVGRRSGPSLDDGWNDRARQVALHFCVFERDVNSPMTDASLARLFYKHIPAAVEMDRSGSEDSPGEARALARSIEKDMVVGRDYDQWLAGYNHLPEGTRELFAKGKGNALNPVLDRLAEVGGYERSDILVREASLERGGLMVKSEKTQQSRLAAMHALGMDQGR